MNQINVFLWEQADCSQIVICPYPAQQRLTIDPDSANFRIKRLPKPSDSFGFLCLGSRPVSRGKDRARDGAEDREIFFFQQQL